MMSKSRHPLLQNENDYNIRTEPHFSNQTEPTSFWTESEFFQNWTKIKKFVPHILLLTTLINISQV